ncbi:MAG: hypothetical protein ACLSB9_28375 [Hydrogeniiclostridium mannosilyticum]
MTAYSDDFENYDLHNFVKAYAAQKNISTQFIREKTLESTLRCQIMWALSLAIYVKSCRIPWVVSGIRPDTTLQALDIALINPLWGLMWLSVVVIYIQLMDKV